MQTVPHIPRIVEPVLRGATRSRRRATADRLLTRTITIKWADYMQARASIMLRMSILVRTSIMVRTSMECGRMPVIRRIQRTAQQVITRAAHHHPAAGIRLAPIIQRCWITPPQV